MKKLFFVLSILVCCSFTIKKVNKPFEVQVRIHANKIELKPNNGFTFSLMAFSKKAAFINESGMINEKLPEEIENSDFIFKVTRKNNKILLEGIKNTNWKKLEIENNAIVNQDGMH